MAGIDTNISQLYFVGLWRKTIARTQLDASCNHEHSSRPDPESVYFADATDKVEIIILFWTWRRRDVDQLLRLMLLRVIKQPYCSVPIHFRRIAGLRR
jgi:hypothetical protein